MEFSNKVVIITGSSTGIGFATAQKLLEHGASVVLNGRSTERLHSAMERLGNRERTMAIACDVTDPVGSRKMVEDTVARFGRLDVLITNAALVSNAKLADIDPAVFKKVFDANLFGSVFPAKYAVPHLERSKGSLVFISSVAGFHGIPENVPYCASKMAITAVAQSLRTELDGTGIHIGVVYPGFTENEENKSVLDASGRDKPVAHRPAWMQQSREQVANSIVRLIKNRRKKAVLSPIGKLYAALCRFSPGLVAFSLKISRRRMKSMFEDKSKDPV
ncbi:MAG TPA: SDR family NAD(P)-dependent oxidoreductase [Bacteroidia bacterium]|jgi:NAD(P)-dependent dehydrogenase (short-subunit alcohol dehydrogenase family)